MGVRQTIEVPDIGDYKDVPIVELMVGVGETVAFDQPLLALESDKATIDVPSPFSGRVVELLVETGQKVSKGVPIAVIELADEDGKGADEKAPGAPPSAPSQAAPLVPPSDAKQASSGADKNGRNEAPVTPAVVAAQAASPLPGSVHATPSVRALARELGLDLSRVNATGPKGRILREDVLDFVKSSLTGHGSGKTASASSAPGIPAMPSFDFAKYGPIEQVALSRIQQISGANLHRNWLNIPHVTNFDNADVTDLESFRVSVNSEKREPPVKLTMVAFLIKAAALSLAAYPRFNTSLDGDTLIQKKYVHIGFAVDTPKGLMVPVIRDCDRKRLIEIASEMSVLSEKARQGKLLPAEMEGGCFSVSSLGGIGGAGFTPIINAPEVAILGAARSQIQAIWDGSGFKPRLIMPISLSWDHRVVDGVAAARFLGHLASLLGDFRRALL